MKKESRNRECESKSGKSKLTVVSEVVSIFGILSIVVAVATFMVNNITYFIPGTMQKAQAGDRKAQIEIADHYYEIGDYANSLYWYKEASRNSGDNRGLAFNNIAVLYYNNFVPDNFNITNPEFYDIILNILDKGIIYGSENASKNRDDFLLSTDASFFIREESIQASKEAKSLDSYSHLKKVMREKSIPENHYPFRYVYDSSYIEGDGRSSTRYYNYNVFLSNEWEYAGLHVYTSAKINTEDIIFEFISSRTAIGSNYTTISYYTYDTYTKKIDSFSFYIPDESKYKITYEKPED